MGENSGIRNVLNGPAGRIVTVFFIVAALAAAAYVTYSNTRQNPAIDLVQNPVFVDSETGKSFHQALSVDLKVPCKSPDTGKMTGYPAELCYWTKDGQSKADPTAVILNETLGRPGPTFCPDCGRLVVHHNSAPAPDVRPPPTRDEYESRHGG